MNDTDIKIVESPKELVGVEVSPASEVNNENETDPLSIDEEVDVKLEPADEGAEKDEVCDDNAKETVTEPEKETNHLETTQTNEVTDEIKEDCTVNEEENVSTEVATKVNDIQEEKTIETPSETAAKEPEVVDRVIEVEDSPKVVETEKVATPDVEMTEVQVDKVNKDPKPSIQTINGDVSKEEQLNKRRASQDIDTESPLKKLCAEVEKTFPQHDVMINDYIQTATKNNVDEIQRHTEQLLSEIQTLRELAQKKEHEWNNILHLKKVKEEILLRLLRRKQVLAFEKSADVNGSDRTDPFDYLQAKNLAIDKSDDISGLAIKQPGSAIVNPIMQAPIMPVTSHFNPMSGLPPPYDKAAHMQSMPKPSQLFPQAMMMPGHLQGFPRDMNGQLPSSYGMPMGRQGPTKDVKSIIADYRQRNPEVTPRRGRRMKPIVNPNMMNQPRPIAPKVDAMNSLSNLNMLFNNLDMNQKAMIERLQQLQAGGLANGISFKDVLVQVANMQNNAGLLARTHDMNRPERRRQERNDDPPAPAAPPAQPAPPKQTDRHAASSPRLPPPPPYPEISLLPVTTAQDASQTQQNSLLHGILTKLEWVLPTFQQASPASQCYSPTLAKLLTSPERKQSAPPLPTFGQAKNCGEITITPVQPATTDNDKTEVVQLEEEESGASEESAGSASAGSGSGSGSGRLVIDEGTDDAPTCQGCRSRLAQFVCAGCANQWYCSRDCQVAAWDDHSEMCSG
ncbi:unnamed protein product [Danaus chrysippus]|uniref:(African queen) hypothetical protein n=1 Tax=Danaus chrysippus TaxID=151541 RepID=A0A8J2QF99_9NEOP|nr:unnamed protein product [Danaus chrysippus]